MDEQLSRIVSLVDLAKLPGMPSQTTLRQIIRDNSDFPVLSWGKHGIAHEIDAAAAMKWFAERRQRELADERARTAANLQTALDIFGEDAAADFTQGGGTPSERRQLMEIELLELKVAEQRSGLVRRSSADVAAAAVLVVIEENSNRLIDALVETLDASPGSRSIIATIMERDLRVLGERLSKISEGASDE